MSDALHTLVHSLQQPRLFAHPVTRFGLVETHISIILLTGDYAYKFKKPVNFGFLDFSTLEKRRTCCEAELRLNRRLAAELYLAVLPVCAGPRFGDDAEVIEYAVQMRQFDQAAQFDRLLQAGRLSAQLIDALAQRIAAFHAGVEVAGEASEYGSPAAVRAPMEENFAQIRNTLPAAAQGGLDALQQWTDQMGGQLQDELVSRQQHGFVRECHGDLHLRNVALVDALPLAFDCIEFNANLRWIDIISEIAFMVMDLEQRGQSSLASRFLNRWLEDSGDYAGVKLLRYYQVYRAMVRAKVDCLRAHQPDTPATERSAILRDYHAYCSLATRYIQPAAPALLLMHGLSGSGKTTVSQYLLEQLPAIRVRSDVERKRLHGLTVNARTGNGVDQGIYDRRSGERTYQRLAALAAGLLDAGHSVIVDAAFLQQEQRQSFLELARARAVTCVLVCCRAPEAVLRQRIVARQRQQLDASEAGIEVLEKQLRQYRPPVARDEELVVLETGSDADDLARLLRNARKVLPGYAAG